MVDLFLCHNVADTVGEVVERTVWNGRNLTVFLDAWDIAPSENIVVGLRPVRSPLYACVQIREAHLEVLPVLAPRHVVDPGCGLALEREVRVAEPIDRDVV